MSILLPPSPLPTYPAYNPGSPDPSPLRLLAFSVAEAALQPDPNSPSLAQLAAAAAGRLPDPLEFDATWTWPKPPRTAVDSTVMHQSTPRRSSRSLWDLAEHAKTRRGSHESALPAGSSPSPSPTSPLKYRFALPANAALAASIAASSSSYAAPFLSSRAPTETRSAAPSPTKPTFAHLDQRRPPPEFVPQQRLSAREFAARPADRPAQHARARSHVEPPVQPRPRALPSLAQIQARVSKAAPPRRIRTTSAEAVAVRPPNARSLSADSIELVTPTDEMRSPLDVLCAAAGKGSDTAASPRKQAPGLPLSSFLRERTSGRLARPASAGAELSITPPKPSAVSVPPPSARRLQTPTRATFAPALVVTPPRAAPGSPTGSAASSASPTLPTITCTPAPSKVVRDGVESDEESDSITLFAGEADDEAGASDDDDSDSDLGGHDARELVGRQMRHRLLMRTTC